MVNKERRRFLNWLLGIFGGISALIISVPLFRFLFPPKEVIEKRRRKMPVANVKEISEGESKIVFFNGNPVMLINYGGRISAVSSICTHMGCFLTWDSRAGQIRCPCHLAAFDVDGNVIMGPPPKPLKTYDLEISDGKIFLIHD